jgi:tetratricopeptide (TPR) repeat protein
MERGNNYRKQKKYSKADSCYQESLDRIEGYFGKLNNLEYLEDYKVQLPDYPVLAKLCMSLGLNYYQRKKYSEANTYFQHSQSIWRDLSYNYRKNYDTLEHVKVLMLMGNNCREQKNYMEAETNYLESLSKLKDLNKKKSTAQGPEYAKILMNRGVNYLKQGRIQEANEQLHQSLEMWAQLVKSNPKAYAPDYAEIFMNMGDYYNNKPNDNKKQDYDSAHIYYQKSRNIWEPLVKKDSNVYNPDYATILMKMGVNYNQQGKYLEADTLYKNSLDVWKLLADTTPEIYDPDYAIALMNMGINYSYQTRYLEADTLYKKSLKILEDKKYKSKYIRDLAKGYMNLGVNYNLQKKYLEANIYYKKSVKEWESLENSKDSCDLALTLMKFGDNLSNSSETYKDAKKNYERCLEILKTIREPCNETMQHDFLYICRKLKNDKDAIKYQKIYLMELIEQRDSISNYEMRIVAACDTLFNWSKEGSKPFEDVGKKFWDNKSIPTPEEIKPYLMALLRLQGKEEETKTKYEEIKTSYSEFNDKGLYKKKCQELIKNLEISVLIQKK